jgi:hypothetical protein
MASFLDDLLERGSNNVQAIVELDEKIMDLQRRIEAEREKTAQKKGPPATAEVVVVIGSDKAEEVDLKLTYGELGALWKA